MVRNYRLSLEEYADALQRATRSQYALLVNGATIGQSDVIIKIEEEKKDNGL